MKTLLIYITFFISSLAYANDISPIESRANILLEESIERYVNIGSKEYRELDRKIDEEISIMVLGLDGKVISFYKKRINGRNIKKYKGANNNALRPELQQFSNKEFVVEILEKASKSSEGKIHFLAHKIEEKEEAAQKKTAKFKVKDGVIFVAYYFEK